MNNFVLEIWDDERTLCTFYTVRWEDAELSETDRFFERYEDESHEFHEAANMLLRLILVNIGDRYGAIEEFFDRSKNKAQALPPKPKNKIPEIEEIGIHFPLRLYCYRIDESLVVLFNGGVKDARTDQGSGDISTKFYEAQGFAKKLTDAFKEQMVLISEDRRYLTDFQGNKDIIL